MGQVGAGRSSAADTGQPPAAGLRQLALVLLALLMMAAAAKQVSDKWKLLLDGQKAGDYLHQRLWGWEAMPERLRNARRWLEWSSYFRLAMAAAATCVGSVCVVLGGGLAIGTAVLAPLLSLGGALMWRNLPDLRGEGVPPAWARVRSFLRFRGKPARSGPMPTIILTGFLGAGKTTLLNRLLKEGGQGGKRFAVIENEIGAVGIDGELVAESLTAEERGNIVPQFVELSDGCICCTVRGDLQEALHSLRPNLSLERIDMLFIETTGLAEPGPVIQTFLADAQLRKA
jgi:hypothetical protein